MTTATVTATATQQTVTASGATYEFKNELKSCGFRFNPTEKIWLFTGAHGVSSYGQAGWFDAAGNFKFADEEVFAWRRQGVEITVE